MSSSVNPSPVGHVEGTISVDEAAARLGMEPKRLRGFILRNGLGDPIGDMERVYAWSLPADTSTAAQAQQRLFA